MIEAERKLGSKALIARIDGGDYYLELPNGDLLRLKEGEDDFERERIKDFFEELKTASYRGKTMVLAARNAVKYLFVYQEETSKLVLLEEIEDGHSIVLSDTGVVIVPFEIEKIVVIKDEFKVMYLVP